MIPALLSLFVAYVVTDCFDRLISKKTFEISMLLNFWIYFVFVSTLFFYMDAPLMLEWGERDDLLFSQVTSYKHSALHSVMS